MGHVDTEQTAILLHLLKQIMTVLGTYDIFVIITVYFVTIVIWYPLRNNESHPE